MQTRFLFLIFVGLATAFSQLCADDGPILTSPPLPLCFPFKTVKEGVTVEYPILINPTTVIQPGALLHCIYLIPKETVTDGAGGFDLNKTHTAELQKAYSRDVRGQKDQEDIPKDLAQAISTAKNIVWTVPNNFQLALAQYPIDFCHLIYTPTGSNNDLVDQSFRFTDGIVVGRPKGVVTVVAMEIGSPGEVSGLKAGDQIVRIGPTEVKDLLGFIPTYLSAKAAARETNQTSFPITIIAAANGQTKVLAMPMPPTFSNSIINP